MNISMWMLIILWVVPAILNITYLIPMRFILDIKMIYLKEELSKPIIFIGRYLAGVIISLIPITNIILLFDKQLGIFWKLFGNEIMCFRKGSK